MCILYAHWPNSSVLNFRFFVHFLICYVLFCHLSLVLGLSCQIKIGTLESIVVDFFSSSFACRSHWIFEGIYSPVERRNKKKCAYAAHTNAKKNKGWNTCWKNKGPLRKIASLNYFFPSRFFHCSTARCAFLFFICMSGYGKERR